MVTLLTVVVTQETNPYKNLALEEYLTAHVKKNECILFLWQNRNTVVIGKNQNSWQECKIDDLEQNNGFLARRLSGGGAVFHDLGNLNFTFIADKENYNVERQLKVILQAVRNFGIQAEKTGRNDLTIDGLKFSGNAFYQGQEACYHHGTIMVNVDKEKMSHYLNPSREKLQSKSVASVKSRVVNLCEYEDKITIERMIESLKNAVQTVYGLISQPLSEDRINEDELRILEDKYQSWQWKHGRKIKFQHTIGQRFAWGDISLEIQVSEGRIQAVNAYSDSMDYRFIEQLPGFLAGCPYAYPAIQERIAAIPVQDPLSQQMQADVLRLFSEKTIKEKREDDGRTI